MRIGNPLAFRGVVAVGGILKFGGILNVRNILVPCASLTGRLVRAALAGTATLALVATLFPVTNVAMAAPGGSVLSPGQTLNPNQSLVSVDGIYRLIMQGDGNLVIYDPNSQALWASGTQGHPGARAIMQTDGNFVIYAPNNWPLWYTNHTGPRPGAYLTLQMDANLVVYSGNQPLWWSGGSGHVVKYDATWNNSLGLWAVELRGCFGYDAKSTWQMTCPNTNFSLQWSVPVQNRFLWSINETWLGTQNSWNSQRFTTGVDWDVSTFGAFTNNCYGRLHFNGTSASSEASCNANGTVEALALGAEAVELLR